MVKPGETQQRYLKGSVSLEPPPSSSKLASQSTKKETNVAQLNTLPHFVEAILVSVVSLKQSPISIQSAGNNKKVIAIAIFHSTQVVVTNYTNPQPMSLKVYPLALQPAVAEYCGPE
ncbi:unnamed protein product [Phytophthora lilii]|uniref:Unnamed protein product n=1 Tax=Phytophthora lilii TaxID=2077276 RepID=A0A9W6UFC3_9STRA|nr:unnamed protein product [Phytophthora lilii]